MEQQELSYNATESVNQNNPFGKLIDLEGRVATHTKPARQCRLRGRIDLSDRNGRVILLQSTGNFFIFWSKLLAMSAPKN